ncbi:MAG TPA: hypothetical protein VMV93_12325 [Chloroflexota bacterium]|nr:hypothetical protein [Chloroflexota bacterium]
MSEGPRRPIARAFARAGSMTLLVLALAACGAPALPGSAASHTPAPLKVYSIANKSITGELRPTATPTFTAVPTPSGTPAPTATVPLATATAYIPPPVPTTESSAQAQSRANQVQTAVVSTQTAERQVQLPGSA